MEASFTDEEKRFILSETIKQSKLDVDVLVQLVATNGLEPDWFSMQLPRGRTMNQCLQAADDMFGRSVSRPSLKRKSIGDLHDQAPKRIAVASPMEPRAPPLISSPLAPAAQLNQWTSTPHSAPIAGASVPPASPNTQLVNIQPRPPPTPALVGATAVAAPLDTVPAQPAPGTRRRGRPSRADKARQLRPLLPQHLTRLVPRVQSPSGPVAPTESSEAHTQGTNSPSTPVTSQDPLPGPGLQEASKAPKKRGRPALADQTKPRTWAGETTKALEPTPPIAQHDSQPDASTAAAMPARHPDTPETSSSSLSHSPQKERAIPPISHLTQEGMAR